ncbi:MAG: ABC transporter substrate-binding protein, partial [Candidatus Cloacimonetes bacterium]|nr:ABC transporter substrate-binding protein [Candidatus Cloacimonadota bacterium]
PEETLAVVMRIMKEHHLPTNISHQRWMLNALKDSVLDDNKPLGVLDREDFAEAKTFILPQNPAINELVYERFFPHGSD